MGESHVQPRKALQVRVKLQSLGHRGNVIAGIGQQGSHYVPDGSRCHEVELKGTAVNKVIAAAKEII